MTVVDATLPAQPAEAVQARPSRLKKVFRFLGYGLAGLVVAVFAANVSWKLSGSNQWTLELEKDGVRVYSLKAPGAYNKQFKAVMRARYSLNHLVGGLVENSTMEVCKKDIPGCIDLKVIDQWSAKTLSDTVIWKLELPPPFAPREMVLRSQVVQDPKSLAVTVNILAAPNAMPRNADSVRLTHIQNRWRYTPVGQGEVEIEFLQDMDLGGMFPTFLMNLGGAEETYNFIHDQLPRLLDRDSLRRVKYDFIKEA